MSAMTTVTNMNQNGAHAPSRSSMTAALVLGLAVLVAVVSVSTAYTETDTQPASNIIPSGSNIPSGMSITFANGHYQSALDHREYDHVYFLTFENTGKHELTIIHEGYGWYGSIPHRAVLSYITHNMTIHASPAYEGERLRPNTFCDTGLVIPPGQTDTMKICYVFDNDVYNADGHVLTFAAQTHNYKVRDGVSDIVRFGIFVPPDTNASTCNRIFGTTLCLSVGEFIGRQYVPDTDPSADAQKPQLLATAYHKKSGYLVLSFDENVTLADGWQDNIRIGDVSVGEKARSHINDASILAWISVERDVRKELDGPGIFSVTIDPGTFLDADDKPNDMMTMRAVITG